MRMQVLQGFNVYNFLIINEKDEMNMKKKIVNIATFAAIALAPLLTNAEMNAPYLKLDLGIALPAKLKGDAYANKKPDNSAHYGIGFGYKVHENVRADFTLSRMHNFKFSETLDSIAVKQNIHSNIGMLNFYGDLGNYSGIAPYVTAGIGFSHNKTKDFNFGNYGGYFKGAEKVNFAWNLGLGASYKMDENICLDLGYKYYDLGKITTADTMYGMYKGVKSLGYKPALTSKLKAHAITLGVRYNF